MPLGKRGHLRWLKKKIAISCVTCRLTEMQNIIWGYHVGLVDSKIYCNDFMPKEKDENGKAIKKEM